MDKLYAGSFTLDTDDEGRKFWRGGGPDDKDETRFNPGEPLILDPIAWRVGTTVTAHEPEAQPLESELDLCPFCGLGPQECRCKPLNDPDDLI